MTTPAEQFQHALREHLGNVVFGMDTVIHGLCLGLIAGGHVLLQGVPGIGKTLLAKTLAARLGGVFKRVQGTSDLMPSDITGVHVYNAEERRFQFMPGPLFAEVLLVDEINRTGPKTQSALLQAMEEGCVTVDRKTYPLPEGFLVIATQNPHDFEGTFPLPESQLDRFLLRLDVAYPDPAMEQRVLQAYGVPQGGHARSGSTAPLPKSALVEVRAQVGAVHVSDAVYRYVIDVAATSRGHHHVSLGLSTRGALGLMRCARIEAALRGAEFVTPDDVKAVARPVMAHRLVLTPDAQLEAVQAQQVVDEVLGSVKVPRE